MRSKTICLRNLIYNKFNVKRSLILAITSIICSIHSIAQTDFIPGYYIVNSKAKFAEKTELNDEYFLYEPRIKDDETYQLTNEDGEYLYTKHTTELVKVRLMEGHVVIALMVVSNLVYCFDLQGNSFVFSSITDLMKAPKTGTIGKMTDSIDIMDGSTLCCGYYWILSQNIVNETVTIQLPKSTIEIKEEKITFLNKSINLDYNGAFENVNLDFMEVTTVK